MSKVTILRILPLVGAFILGAGETSQAELRLPAVFSDHMVLQANRETSIWGWAAPGSSITVVFQPADGKELVRMQTETPPSGRWTGRLSQVPAGTAGSMVVTSSDGGKKEIFDVLAGEVWLGSGQSNMDYTVGAANVPKPMQEEQKAYADTITPQIRLFGVKDGGADEPLDDVGGEWLVTTSDNVRHFPAVAWYFAKTLQKELNVPVGMIVSAVGGTPISAWIPRSALDKTSVSDAIWQRHQKALQGYEPKLAAYEEALAAWKEKYPTIQLQYKNRPSAPKEPYSPSHKTVPTRLYNGMLHGLAGYTLSGILWYQGEQDANAADQYPELIKTLIGVLRDDCKGEVPFYYVELANYMPPQKSPVEEGWPAIREAQSAALELPKTGVATAIDLGMADEIHPPYKDTLGARLAMMALGEVYGKESKGVRSPSFEAFQIEGDKVRLRFRDADGLRTKSGSPESGFAIQGEDGNWLWGQFRIEGNEIVVWNDKVKAPVAVRYAWASNPVLSVENEKGLPLRPFRTDKTTTIK